MTAKQKNMRSMSVAKRTRNQVALREKELREKKSSARLEALGKHRKLCAEKKRNRPMDENGEEAVKVVSEAEYMRRVSRLENRESSPSRDVAFEGNSHASVQVVAEKWNPFGVPFDNDDVENVGKHHHSDTSVGYESPTRGRGYKDGDGFSDSHHSIMVSDDDISTEGDDNSSDDDFRVDDERRNVDSSGESGEHDDYDDDSLEDMCRGRVNTDKNTNYRGWESVHVDNSMEDRGRESVLDDIVVGDDEYMQWLGDVYDVDKNQTESPKDVETEILGCSENAEFEAPENINVEIGPAAESFDVSENSGSGKRGCKKAWIKSESESEKRGKSEKAWSESKSESEKRGMSEKGGSRRTRRTERMNVVVSTASDDDDEYVKWISSKYGMNIIRDESHRKTNIEIKSEPENDHMSENSLSLNSVDRQRGQLPESRNVGIKPNLDNDWPEELRSARNGSNKKRGRKATDKNVVEECEASSYAHSSSSPYFPSYKNSGNGKRRKSDFENIGCSANSKE